jgi:hypothetical protein
MARCRKHGCTPPICINFVTGDDSKPLHTTCGSKDLAVTTLHKPPAQKSLRTNKFLNPETKTEKFIIATKLRDHA